jgi:hypothetical protein
MCSGCAATQEFISIALTNKVKALWEVRSISHNAFTLFVAFSFLAEAID